MGADILIQDNFESKSSCELENDVMSSKISTACVLSKDIAMRLNLNKFTGILREDLAVMNIHPSLANIH